VNVCRRVASVVLLVALGVPAGAQESHGRVFLWKITSKKTTAWLLGSVHVASPDLYPLDPRIEKAFAASDALVVEADTAGLQGLAAAGDMLARGTYPAGDTIERHIPAALYRETAARLAKHGIPPEQWSSWKPWLVSMTIAMADLQSLGISPESGIDLHFLTVARGQKKILELESISEQLRLLDGFDDRQQALFLEYTLRDADNLSRNMDEMFQAWRSGDPGKLERLIAEPRREEKELEPIYRKLLDERNERMAKKIEAYLDGPEKVFIVVGAAHLVGERGLVRLLSKKLTVAQE
jgi:hypothetical protein